MYYFTSQYSFKQLSQSSYIIQSDQLIMPANKINNDINNNIAYVGEEKDQTRRFIRNRNYSKKDNKLSKDNKSHKKEHHKRVTKRIQDRIAIKQKEKEREKELVEEEEEKEEPTVYRIPQPKKPRTTAVVFKGQPKHKAQENWNDQWEDTELGETFDLEEARKEIYRDYWEDFFAFEMPREIEDEQRQEYEEAQFEIDKMIAYFGPNVTDEMICEPKAIVTRYENQLRLKELSSGLTMTLTEYEKEKAMLKEVWIAYKAQCIPRHLFDGTIQCEENVLKLEMCELEPVINKKLRNELKTKIQEWEDYLDHYYTQQKAEMDEYFAQQEAEFEEQELLQMIENSEQLQVFVSNLQKD